MLVNLDRAYIRVQLAGCRMSGDTAMASLPPAYSSDTVDLDSYASELPSYERRPTPPPQLGRQAQKEFTAELTRKGKPWAVFTLLANASLSTAIPTILEGSDITGSVKLDIGDKDDGIQSIVVSVS